MGERALMQHEEALLREADEATLADHEPVLDQCVSWEEHRALEERVETLELRFNELLANLRAIRYGKST